jgi:hypothetical protein
MIRRPQSLCARTSLSRHRARRSTTKNISLPRRLQTLPRPHYRAGFHPRSSLLPDAESRWKISAKRAKAVISLVREQGHRVSEVARFLRRDQAKIQYDAVADFSKGTKLYRVLCLTLSPSQSIQHPSHNGCLIHMAIPRNAVSSDSHEYTPTAGFCTTVGPIYKERLIVAPA